MLYYCERKKEKNIDKIRDKKKKTKIQFYKILVKFNVEGRRTAKCGYLHHLKDDFFMLIFFSRWILEICLKNIGNCVYCMRTWGYSTTCFVCFGYIKNKRLFLLKMILLWNKYSRHWSFLFHRKYINLWSAPFFFSSAGKRSPTWNKDKNWRFPDLWPELTGELN